MIREWSDLHQFFHDPKYRHIYQDYLHTFRFVLFLYDIFNPLKELRFS